MICFTECEQGYYCMNGKRRKCPRLGSNFKIKFKNRLFGQYSAFRLFWSNPFYRGSYQPEKGASFCHLTDPGSYQDEDKSTAPKTCPGLKKADFGITRKTYLK